MLEMGISELPDHKGGNLDEVLAKLDMHLLDDIGQNNNRIMEEIIYASGCKNLGNTK